MVGAKSILSGWVGGRKVTKPVETPRKVGQHQTNFHLNKFERTDFDTPPPLLNRQMGGGSVKLSGKKAKDGDQRRSLYPFLISNKVQNPKQVN